jgi:hypothetical protein
VSAGFLAAGFGFNTQMTWTKVEISRIRMGTNGALACFFSNILLHLKICLNGDIALFKLICYTRCVFASLFNRGVK